MKKEKKEKNNEPKKEKIWRQPTLKEFKFAGCMLNGPSAS